MQIWPGLRNLKQAGWRSSAGPGIAEVQFMAESVDQPAGGRSRARQVRRCLGMYSSIEPAGEIESITISQNRERRGQAGFNGISLGKVGRREAF